tara:strand:+ start:1504 stop:2373 length:870 start_codon:yes stop_codon:yes gene_type:complete
MESEETAAPAAEAPAVDTAPAPEAAAAPEGSASDTEVNPSRTEQPAAFPSADEFGWDDWKGEVDNLPEQIRGWATPMQSYYQKWADDKAASMVDDATSLKELYNSLLEGKEDPRVAEYAAKLKELEEAQGKATSEWETKYGDLEKTYKDYQANVEATIEREADQYAKWFKSENADLFENETLAATFVALLDEGWEMETAATAARLPAAALNAARQAKADGVPDEYALRLSGGAESPSAPRPGASLTAGATSQARSSEQMALPEAVEATSFRDLRSQAARLALNPRKRGR